VCLLAIAMIQVRSPSATYAIVMIIFSLCMWLLVRHEIKLVRIRSMVHSWIVFIVFIPCFYVIEQQTIIKYDGLSSLHSLCV
jgi:hypothetical protein